MQRDLRLDSIRGLLLAEIAFVHVHSPSAQVFYEGLGRVSTAAAFVFLSGLVAGAVYGRFLERGARAVLAVSLRRALYIHAYHLATFLLLLAAVALSPRSHEYLPILDDFSWAGIGRGLAAFAVLAHQPKFFDILPMYAVFVLVMPLALLAFARGLAPLVLAVSLGLWAAAQAGWGGDGAFGGGFFNPLAWQVLFFAGLFIGDAQLRRGVAVVRASLPLAAVCAAICVAGFTLRWNLLDWPAAFAAGTPLSRKSDFGAAYLVNFFACAYLVFCLARHRPRLFVWRPLAFLGQHSIQVFSFHILAVYLTGPLVWRAKGLGPWGYDALAVAVVLSLFAAAGLHRWHRAWRRRTAPGHLRAPAAA